MGDLAKGKIDLNGYGDVAGAVMNRDEGGTAILTINEANWRNHKHTPVHSFFYKTGDFDGDGRDDLLHFYSSEKAVIWYGKSDSTFERVDWDDSNSGLLDATSKTHWYVIPGDFNGDGKTDLVYFTSDGTHTTYTAN